MPPCPALVRSQTGNHDYDVGVPSGLAFDAESPSVTTEAFSRLLAVTWTNPAYDPRCASAIPVVGDPRPPAAGIAKFLAAKGTPSTGIGLESRGLRPAPGTRVPPEGIPDSWKVRPTRGDGGVQYYNPANPNQNVRVMQGNPNSPHPNSQAPYVRQQNAGGTYLRQDGTPSPLPNGGLRDGDAHIPLDKFIFRP